MQRQLRKRHAEPLGSPDVSVAVQAVEARPGAGTHGSWLGWVCRCVHEVVWVPAVRQVPAGGPVRAGERVPACVSSGCLQAGGRLPVPAGTVVGRHGYH
jgi:hypothetical protein